MCLYCRNIDSTILLLPKPRGYAVRYVSDLVGNPEDRFSHDMAHFFHKPAIQVEILTRIINLL